MAIHLIYSVNSATQAEKYIGTDDIQVFLADGIYYLTSQLPSNQVYALTEDAQVRGVDVPQHQQLDYPTLVGLLCKNTPVVSWNS